MTSLFLDVLNTSFAATWVVLAVVLARPLLKKAPRWMVCGLWALVAARLLIGSGITAPFSMIPSAEVIPPQSLYEQAPAIHSGVTIIDNAVNPVYTESLRPMPGASVNPLQVWTAVYANIWVLGMAIMALWAVVSWDRVRRQVRESICEDGVYLCDRIASPFIFGLFRPKIYLPSDLSDYARTHVIAHERAHLLRRDHWWKPLGFALLTINWFNPAMWLAYLLLCRDIEMACDEKVVRDFGAEEKKAYSAALLRCSVNSRRITACPLAFGEVGVKARIKSVLNYKKPTFWVILAALILTTVLAAGLLTSPADETEPAEIRWNGKLYVQFGEVLDFVPDKQKTTGVLLNIQSNSSGHPTQQAQAVGLGREYVGQTLVEVGYALYLLQPDGTGWLPFRLYTGADAMGDSIGEDTWYHLTLRHGRLSSNEELTGTAADALAELLQSLTQQKMTPGPGLDRQQYADSFDALITIQPEQSGICYELFRTADHGWVCLIRDLESGDSDWYFNGSSLDSFLLPYESELKRAGNGILLTEETALSLDFRTMEKDGFVLRSGIPILEEGDTHTHWEWEPMEDAVGFRCRPMGRQDWMEVRFYDQEDPIEHHAFHAQPITFATGNSGTLRDSGDPARWGLIILDTTRGQLHIAAPDNVFQRTDWSEEDFKTALVIPAMLSLTENGTSLLTGVLHATDVPNLGISMHLENITSDGATLVCTQDGTLWHEIITGSDWFLQEYQDGIWVDLMPDETVWTTVAYPIPIGGSRSFTLNWSRMIGSLEPGRYRIVKSFSGYEQITLHQASKEPFTQICSVEFELNPLGIQLHIENVAPGGAKLICTQDGTPWKTITTGTAFTLEKHTADGWVSILPEDITWSAIAIGVKQGGTTSMSLNWNQFMGVLEPGRYRVGKTFLGTGELTTEGFCAVGEGIRQTCYAEFLIEEPSVSSQEQARLSDELRQAIQEYWRAYDAMGEFDRLASSTTPGFGTREFDDWTAVEQFVGLKIPNPLEALESLEKGNWAAATVGYNGGARFYVTFSGTRDGQVQQVTINSGYRRGELRVSTKAALFSDPTENAGSGIITADSGEEYEARTAALTRDSIGYTIRVMGDPGTGDKLTALLEELLPYFEELPA